MIIVSVGSRIDHWVMSESLKAVDGIDWLHKREAVPRNTPTFTFNRVAENVRSAMRIEESSNPQDWFGGHRRIGIGEDVVGLGSYDKTLTVIHDINLPEPEEYEARTRQLWSSRGPHASNAGCLCRRRLGSHRPTAKHPCVPVAHKVSHAPQAAQGLRRPAAAQNPSTEGRRGASMRETLAGP